MPLDPKTLNDRHYVAMTLQASGRYNLIQIADAVGLNPTYLRNLAQTSLYKAELQVMRERMRGNLLSGVTDRLINEAEGSIEDLIALKNDPSTPRSLRARIAQDLLDRIPQTSKVHRGQQLQGQGLTLTDDQITLLADTFARDTLAQQALQEAREALGPSIEFSDSDSMINVTPGDGELANNGLDDIMSSLDTAPPADDLAI